MLGVGLIKVAVFMVGVYTIYKWYSGNNSKYKINGKKIYDDIQNKIKEYKLDEHYRKIKKKYILYDKNKNKD